MESGNPIEDPSEATYSEETENDITNGEEKQQPSLRMPPVSGTEPA